MRLNQMFMPLGSVVLLLTIGARGGAESAPAIDYQKAADASETGVTVYGWESAGRYIETKDVRTGETLGHKVFDAAGR
ncbi:MAG TPA: hypothetical protein VG269_18590 [Tepidisphaeraceae bacterium]|nr:hypothetical protein [Tepidisphaeraceae bacterium]